MLKVVIADDEARVCRLIQMLMDWEALNMKLVGIAANGLEALQMVEEWHPDILITDIRMPGCDGLELIEKVRQLNSQMEIVIISGYAQFEYAQLAIQREVSGYLLKPIKKEALQVTLEKLGERVRERINSETVVEHLKLDEQKRQTLLRERLLDDLIHQRLDAPTWEEMEEVYGFPKVSGLFQVFIIKIDNDGNILNEAHLRMITEKIKELLETEVFPRCYQVVLQFYRSTGYGILHFAGDMGGEIRRQLRECLNQLQVQRGIFGAAEFTLVVGRAAEVGQLPDSMRDAGHAVAERLVEGTGRLLEAVPVPSLLNIRHLLEKYSRTMNQAAESFSAAEAVRAVAELAAAARETTDVRGYELLELVLNAAGMFIIRLNPEQKDTLLKDFAERCEWCSREAQLFEALEQFLLRQLETVWEQQRSEAIRPIRLAKQYIGQHYMEPITLEEVCDAIGFSVSYFSTMFKKETGEGFSKHLTRVRIEHAKTLFQDTNLPVAEICEQVGYSDLKHFISNFKKVTGLNPGQYRKLYG